MYTEVIGLQVGGLSLELKDLSHSSHTCLLLLLLIITILTGIGSELLAGSVDAEGRIPNGWLCSWMQPAGMICIRFKMKKTFPKNPDF